MFHVSSWHLALLKDQNFSNSQSLYRRGYFLNIFYIFLHIRSYFLHISSHFFIFSTNLIIFLYIFFMFLHKFHIFPFLYSLFIEEDSGMFSEELAAQKTTKGRTAIHVRMAMQSQGVYGRELFTWCFVLLSPRAYIEQESSEFFQVPGSCIG